MGTKREKLTQEKENIIICIRNEDKISENSYKNIHEF